MKGANDLVKLMLISTSIDRSYGMGKTLEALREAGVLGADEYKDLEDKLKEFTRVMGITLRITHEHSLGKGVGKNE